jgi:hypothetical protein
MTACGMPGAKKKALEKAGARCYRDFKFLPAARSVRSLRTYCGIVIPVSVGNVRLKFRLRPRCKESNKEIMKK